MSAKQQSNNQHDSADDLIAELSKLMAQDTDKPTSRSPSAAEAPQPENDAREDDAGFAFRLPEENKPAAEHAPSARPASSGAANEAPAEAAPEPRFDFSRSEASDPVGAATDEEPVGQRDSDGAYEQDVIGNLIAAEFADDEPVSTEPHVSQKSAQQDAPQSSSTAARSEDDSFRVAPVFGLDARGAAQPDLAGRQNAAPEVDPAATRAAPQQPPRQSAPQAAARDPKRDMEALIGEAAAIERRSTASKPAASAALRSLATPVLPRGDAQKAAPRSSQGTVAHSAEDAILAAAAATGARVGWIEPDEEAAFVAPAAGKPKPARKRGGVPRAIVGPSVALVLLLIAGGALYWVLGSSSDDSPPPVLTADSDPVKELPQASDEPSRQSVVFDEMDGVSAPAENEELVSRDQSLEGTISDEPPVDTTDSGLVNRRVRTVTVRPDGTIVSGESGLAGAAALPVDRPNVPDVSDEGSSEQIAEIDGTAAGAEASGNAAASPVSDDAIGQLLSSPSTEVDGTAAETESPLADETSEVDGTTLTANLQPLVPGQEAPVVDQQGEVVPNVTAPVPMSRISRTSSPIGPVQLSQPTSPVNAVNEPQTTGAVQQQEGAPAQRTLFGDLFGNNGGSNTSSASNAPAYVQLSSQRTEDAARQTAQSIANRFGPIFNGVPLEIQRVDLGNQGIYYRVRLPAQSASQATQICNAVKSNGGDCFTI
ncbi:hypothetical protein GCM10007989_01600 [Devosia pacifica]|uniref:SPOR domain-containing protein n=1 Tax=Devosia pacifica TaxID=1335967 RepID=A0A918RUK1_9HYPH|nr:SPOR domain-containing protein [Devosia pacifica]GHA10980.1 hypothetical protein GCM10007989_01600 [Devosia pacifica]